MVRAGGDMADGREAVRLCDRSRGYGMDCCLDDGKSRPVGEKTPSAEPIPRLRETDGIPFDDKIIHQRWTEPQTGFYWLIAEYDPKDDLAFGYANLACDVDAEWGLIPIAEIKGIGAVMDESWKPVPFAEARRADD